jgi:hypothetical protein
MGMGSKVCIQLFHWLASVVEIAKMQAQFISFITSSFPDWLPKLQGFQQSARALEQEIAIDERCFNYLDEVLISSDDHQFVSELQREMNKIKKTLIANKLH